MTENDKIQQLKTEISEHLYLEGVIVSLSKRVDALEDQVASIRNRMNRLQAELKDEDEEPYRIDQGTIRQVDPELALKEYLASLQPGQPLKTNQ